MFQDIETKYPGITSEIDRRMCTYIYNGSTIIYTPNRFECEIVDPEHVEIVRYMLSKFDDFTCCCGDWSWLRARGLLLYGCDTSNAMCLWNGNPENRLIFLPDELHLAPTRRILIGYGNELRISDDHSQKIYCPNDINANFTEHGIGQY